ncbi:CPBP family intramembrane glutamic endopeptidase [Acetivibrio cellulolyticus]|uniref:CPBP family intramembrane glutamic endopeptidase n=1 Tax=Acetivibrio cellulolyticus TaxID=35830 RepID=UPI0001E2D140|nr:CPBP family intramembrane glutamic endopeptidase [Acetivibrio cellulolyticus]
MKKYLIMLGNLLLYIGTYFLIIKSLVFVGRNYVLPQPGIGPWLNKNSLVVTVTSDLIQFTIFYFMFKKLKGKSLFEHVKLTKKISAGNLAIISIIGISAGFFTSAVFKLPYITEKYPDLVAIMKFMFVDGGNVVVFTCFLLVGSVFKEILFRGLIFNEFRNAFPLALAVLLQGLMYGILFFSFSPPLMVYGFIGAVLFTILYVLVDSLWAPIIAQATCQGSMYILMITGDVFVNKNTVIPLIVISMIIIVAGTVYMTKKTRKELNSISV